MAWRLFNADGKEAATAGGGAAVPVQEGGSTVTATPSALNFTAGFDVSDVGGVATVDLDEGELDFSAATLSPSGLVLPGATAPAQTAEGSAVWDTNDDRLTIGDGTARKTFLPSDTQFVQGTHATRIAAAHVAGRLYRETDTGLIYYDDGTNWVIWMGDGYIRKTANETVNNSVALQNDDHLFWPVEASRCGSSRRSCSCRRRRRRPTGSSPSPSRPARQPPGAWVRPRARGLTSVSARPRWCSSRPLPAPLRREHRRQRPHRRPSGRMGHRWLNRRERPDPVGTKHADR